MKVSRLLVPVNGSSTDRQALELACSAAKRNKAKVYAICVIEVKRTLPLDAELEPEVQKAEGVLDRAEKIADEADYTVETEILQAREVGPAIVDEATERAVDVIVMGVPTAPESVETVTCRFTAKPPRATSFPSMTA